MYCLCLFICLYAFPAVCLPSCLPSHTSAFLPSISLFPGLTLFPSLLHPLPGSIVAAILASDSDAGVNGEVTYSLEEEDAEDDTFLLNPVTGVFNVTRPLDYETQRFYVLTARARDGGGQASAVRVYFNVLDVNDNAPVFNASAYSRSVSESLPPGASILTLAASDADDGGWTHCGVVMLALAASCSAASQ